MLHTGLENTICSEVKTIWAVGDKVKTPAQRQRAGSLLGLSSEEGKESLQFLLVSAHENVLVAPVTHEHAINYKLLPSPISLCESVLHHLKQ